MAKFIYWRNNRKNTIFASGSMTCLEIWNFCHDVTTPSTLVERRNFSWLHFRYTYSQYRSAKRLKHSRERHVALDHISYIFSLTTFLQINI